LVGREGKNQLIPVSGKRKKGWVNPGRKTAISQRLALKRRKGKKVKRFSPEGTERGRGVSKFTGREGVPPC